MEIESIQADFDQSLTTWQDALYHYRDPELKAPLEADGWTIGQVYNHLLDSTQFYHLKQIERCLEHHDHLEADKTPEGEQVMKDNAFPPVRIHVPPSPQYTPDQPIGRAELVARCEELGMIVGMITHQVKLADNSGKAQHHTLGYLDAREWLQLIAIHWRHHLRQKARLDGLLAAKP